MIPEAKQQYRGVLCGHCRQPIPLPSSAVSREKASKEPSGLDVFAARSFALRCRACQGERLYTALQVIDFDGTPRLRSSQAGKPLPRVSERNPDYVLDLKTPRATW